MEELLEFVGVKNHLKFGEYCFSPIMEASAGIALEYCKKVEKDKQEISPMFFCFPEKKGAALWTSLAILTNYFLEDYIDNVLEGIDFKKFDKVKIYNCIAEVERITKDKVYLKFKDQGGIPIKNSLQSQISIVPSQRTLSLFKKYKSNLKESKTKRNAISKILVPNDPETINQNNLDSKVLLIAGRGNSKKIHELLNGIIIYDEPLSKIFPEKKNLIISPDLKIYKDLFDSEKEEKFIKFKESLKKLESFVESDVKSTLYELNLKLDNEEQISIEFDIQYSLFLKEFINEIPKLKFIESLYPGYQDSFPHNLRAVVINDINQLNDYSETIKGFLKKGIPVIFISDRNIENTYEIDFYNRLFKLQPQYYRLNWNRKKIVELNKCSTTEEYIDRELWDQCLNYSIQQVRIKVSEKNDLDTLVPKLLKQITDLDSYELLQKSFFNSFYPAMFALKNSLKSNYQVQELILEFQNVFNESKNNGIPYEIIDDFENAIRLAISFTENSKQYDLESNVFSNLLIISSHNKIFIPIEKNKINVPTSSTNSILFTGYPYNEFSGKYLLNSVCRNFIPNITILCWPNESSLTMGYLKRRLKSGYFSDHLFDEFPIKNEFLLKDEKDFESEIDSFLNMNSNILLECNQETNLEYLHTFKYKGYDTKNEGGSSFSVKCHILNFDDGSFMFLPKGSTIMAQSEDNQGKTTINETNFNDLNIGFKIYKYKKDRSTYREISKNDKKIKDCFEKLEIWKDALEKVYKISDSNLETLELLLNQTKVQYNLIEGNPIRSSLHRWLFDDEIICPRLNNLKIILLAAKVENFEQKLTELNNAFKEVSSFTIGLSSNIKKNIAKQLSSIVSLKDDFYININGNLIKVESRTITSLDKNQIEIDYHNTRKILC